MGSELDTFACTADRISGAGPRALSASMLQRVQCRVWRKWNYLLKNTKNTTYGPELWFVLEFRKCNPSSPKHCIALFLVSICSWKLLFPLGNAAFKVARKRNLCINIIKHLCAVQELVGNVPLSSAKFFACLRERCCALDVIRGFLLNLLAFPMYSVCEKYWSHCATGAPLASLEKVCCIVVAEIWRETIAHYSVLPSNVQLQLWQQDPMIDQVSHRMCGFKTAYKNCSQKQGSHKSECVNTSFELCWFAGLWRRSDDGKVFKNVCSWHAMCEESGHLSWITFLVNYRSCSRHVPMCVYHADMK